VPLDDRAGRGMKVMCAPVIAESAPVREHARERCGRQHADRRKRHDDTQVIRQHRRDLRLLQHHLGQPDAISVARALPRQVVAAVRALPGDDARRERLGNRCQG
jgi:hypothetical protein